VSGFRITLFFPLILLCWWSANVAARSFDDIIESKYINIAVYNDYPPYSYLDADTARGIDVDIAK
jgi:polar amino acid transport system substrate-binding protein